ncbi:hypothetical protein PUN28_017325 [Cardiocondyla obscurior]|uniref:Uncharacterized protein n=1 Tax=Cardiocondyla obscurior TaxID=286306 RepID=A0AAW2EP28_9HYME
MPLFPLTFPPPHLDTSFVFLIPHHLAEVFETGASASESFNEIDFTPRRTTKVPASKEIVLGMLDDVLLTVSHVLFLQSLSFAKCEVLEAAATLLETSISGRIRISCTYCALLLHFIFKRKIDEYKILRLRSNQFASRARYF